MSNAASDSATAMPPCTNALEPHTATPSQMWTLAVKLIIQQRRRNYAALFTHKKVFPFTASSARRYDSQCQGVYAKLCIISDINPLEGEKITDKPVSHADRQVDILLVAH